MCRIVWGTICPDSLLFPTRGSTAALRRSPLLRVPFDRCLQARHQPGFEASPDLITPFLVPPFRGRISDARRLRGLAGSHRIFGKDFLEHGELFGREACHDGRFCSFRACGGCLRRWTQDQFLHAPVRGLRGVYLRFRRACQLVDSRELLELTAGTADDSKYLAVE